MDVQRLISLLRQAPDVDKVALGVAVMEYERWGSDVLRCLINKQAISEARLLTVLSQLWGVPSVELGKHKPRVALIRMLPTDVADKHRAIPFRLEGSFLDVAFDEPSPEAVDAVRVRTQHNIRPHVANPRAIDRALALHYGRMNVGGYQVDPRVTSGTLLRSDLIDLETGEPSMSIPVDVSSFEDEPSMRAARGDGMEALAARIVLLQSALDRAQQRIQLLEAHVARDEDVLRRLVGFMVDKKVGTQEEFVDLLR